MAEQAFRPSQAVPTSGVYRVEHHGHRDPHEAILLEGSSFPACSVCQERVRYTLQRPANNIRSDKDFLAGK
jgi:hypothetical protein